MKNKKTTSQDIAQVAGVSQPTVSRALRNSPLVSEATKARIFAIARELNYPIELQLTESSSPASLAILLAMPVNEHQSGLSPFVLQLIEAIACKAAASEFNLQMGLRHGDGNWEHLLDEIAQQNQGVIFIGNDDYIAYQDKLALLQSKDIPFVAWGPVVANQRGVFVGFDNLDGGYKATQHLINLGHTRIAFIGNISDFRPEFAARYQGYAKALLHSNIIVDPSLRADARSSEEDGVSAIYRLTQNHKDISAVVCASDSIALGVLTGLRELGMQVPQHIAATGFGDLFYAKHLFPPLTTVRQDATRAGALLVEQLTHMIHGSELQSLELPVELIIRDSCGHSLNQ